MNEREFEAMIDRTLGDHQLVEPKPTKSWHVRNPDRRAYWFDIVWTPGILSISGDMQSLTLTHFQAMPTWVDAVSWIKHSDIDYLLEKSNAAQEYDHERTVSKLVEIANEDQHYYEDASVWKDIFARVFDAVGHSFYLLPYNFPRDAERWLIDNGHDKPRKGALNHRNKAHQSIIAKALREEFDSLENTPVGYGLFEIGARFCYRWPSQAIWQIKAIKRWADLVSESEEYQYESALAAQKTA